MSRGNGSEGSHSEAGRSARGKGEGVADMGVDDRPEGVELKVGVTGVPAAEEARERVEEEVGNDNFRGMAMAMATAVVGDSFWQNIQRGRERRRVCKIRKSWSCEISKLRYCDRGLGR